MPAKVILTCLTGSLQGQQFVFHERTTRILGRDDCSLVIPDEQRRISRHHCLLDVNPPDVTVRDFRSLNGTFINGQLIGRRPAGTPAPGYDRRTPLPLAVDQSPVQELHDGDELRLAETVTFRVSIIVPVYCAACSA